MVEEVLAPELMVSPMTMHLYFHTMLNTSQGDSAKLHVQE